LSPAAPLHHFSHPLCAIKTATIFLLFHDLLHHLCTGTTILVFEGTASTDGKTITQESHYDTPIKGPLKWRSVTKIVDDNTWSFEMYETDKGGKEEKMMEITYTRRTVM
jgi:hypothetical protein